MGEGWGSCTDRESVMRDKEGRAVGVSVRDARMELNSTENGTQFYGETGKMWRVVTRSYQR